MVLDSRCEYNTGGLWSKFSGKHAKKKRVGSVQVCITDVDDEMF